MSISESLRQLNELHFSMHNEHMGAGGWGGGGVGGGGGVRQQNQTNHHSTMYTDHIKPGQTKESCIMPT